MKIRAISALSPALLLLLAACGGKAGKPGVDTIDCRFDGKPAFENVCTLERTKSPEGKVLVLRRPDGSFHRLLVVKDGRGVIAADGAEPVHVAKGEGDSIEIDVGTGVYRLPAKIKP